MRQSDVRQRRLLVSGLVVLTVVAGLRAAARRPATGAQPARPAEPPPPRPPEPAPAAAAVDVAPPEPALAEQPVAEPAPRRRRRRPVLAAVLAALVAAAVAATVFGRHVQRPTLLPAAATPATVTGSGSTTQTQPTQPTQPTQTTQPATTAAPRPTTTAPSGVLVPSRTFVWPARPGATGYSVTFTRDGATVLQVTTKAARLELPRTFAFRAGRYRWVVWALPRSAGDAPRADSRFTLTAAAAAAANP